MPETISTAAERELRRAAAKPVYRRLRADKERAPDLAGFLDTIEERLFEQDFSIGALWVAHGINPRKGASERFAPLGSCPSAYLTDCRLRVAAWLLAHTTLPVYRIIELCGYASKGPFWKAFKSWSGGRTPGQYRESPDQDPHSLPASIDLSKVVDPALLERPLNRKKGLELCRHLLEGLEPEVEELLDLVDAAQATADYETALRLLGQAATHPGRTAYQDAIDRRIALATHCRGAVLTLEGDVDRAFDDLALACRGYAQAGVLEPDLERRRRRLEAQVSCSTDNALSSALCRDCRRALLLEVGESLRRHLRRALELVPLDLPWFGVCCDDCYRVVWKAISLARHGLLNDAYHAWWLATHIDFEDSSAPASVGRIIAALAKVDSLSWSSQKDRLKMCDLALRDATVLGKHELITVTRLWRGVVLCALALYPEARSSIQCQPTSPQTSWITALKDRFAGVLERATTNHREALACLESATRRYQVLDPHLVGLMIAQQATVYLDLHEYERGIVLCRKASPLIDDRRGIGPPRALLPILEATALALGGDPEKAKAELSRYYYDRIAYPAVAAVEIFTKGCIALMSGKAREALQHYQEAQHRLERTGQLKHAAVTATCSVEAHCILGDRDRGAVAAIEAGKFFESVGCARDTLVALAKLQSLIAEGASVKAVAASARRLAAQHGGWLPPDDHLPG